MVFFFSSFYLYCKSSNQIFTHLNSYLDRRKTILSFNTKLISTLKIPTDFIKRMYQTNREYFRYLFYLLIYKYNPMKLSDHA